MTEKIIPLDLAYRLQRRGEKDIDENIDPLSHGARECEEKFPFAASLSLVIAGESAKLLCSDSHGQSLPLREVTVSRSLAARLQAADAEEVADVVRTAMQYPAAKVAMAKIKKKLPISLSELSVVTSLAREKEPGVDELLEERQSMAQLLGRKEIGRLTYQDIMALRGVFRQLQHYWPHEFPRLLMEAYRTAVQLTPAPSKKRYEELSYRDQEQDPIIVGRQVTRASAALMLEHLSEEYEPHLAAFFLSEVLQKPHPETCETIEKFLKNYDRLPIQMRTACDAFLKKKFDVYVAGDSNLTFFGAETAYARLLLFVARRYGREDAREAFESLMYEELALGRHDALNLYLEEYVEKDGNLQAVAQIKRILMGKIEQLSPQARVHTLYAILDRDKSFRIFEPFIRGKEMLSAEKAEKPKGFNLPQLMIDFAPPTGEIFTPLGSEESADQMFYDRCIAALLKRSCFAGVQAHLDYHYDRKFSDSPVYPYYTLIEALKYREMHPYLKAHVDRGGPHLGFYVLEAALEGALRRRVDMSDSPPPSFFPSLKGYSAISDFIPLIQKSSLASIQRHMEAEADVRYGSRPFVDRFDRAMKVFQRAFYEDFKEAPDTITRGLHHPNVSFRHSHVTFWGHDFPIGLTETDVRDPANHHLAFLYDHLKDLDLSYLTELAMAVQNQITDDGQREKDMAKLAEDSGKSLPALLTQMHNQTIAAAYDGFYQYMEGKEISCVEYPLGSQPSFESAEYEIRDSLKEVGRSLRAALSRSDEASRESLGRDVAVFLSMLSKNAKRDTNLIGPTVHHIRSFAFIPETESQAVETLIQLAIPGQAAGLEALEALVVIDNDKEVSPASKARIRRFFAGVVCSALEKPLCDEASQEEWHARKRKVLRKLLSHGNAAAYQAFRDSFLSDVRSVAAQMAIEDADSEDLRERHALLQQELSGIALEAAMGAGGGKLAQAIARDMSHLFQSEGEAMDGILAGAKKSGLFDFLPGNATRDLALSLGLQKMTQFAEESDQYYAMLSLLAQSNIPSLSGKARLAMMRLSHDTETRQQIFATFAQNARSFVEAPQRNQSQQDDVPF
ncbi:MAG: hypothetical protein HY540_04700 [Deltaproteobacteria bacterium]|nr:hypothetical protein [Deltaproteobacteria bacterium]